MDESDGDSEEAAEVVRHTKAPLVHGWLGSLVTPEWWSNGGVGNNVSGSTDGALQIDLVLCVRVFYLAVGEMIKSVASTVLCCLS